MSDYLGHIKSSRPGTYNGNARTRKVQDVDPTRHGDRPRDEIGAMRVMIWGALLMLSLWSAWVIYG